MKIKIKIKIKSAFKQIKNFPAEAGPTGVRSVLFSGTGFSREEATAGTGVPEFAKRDLPWGLPRGLIYLQRFTVN